MNLGSLRVSIALVSSLLLGTGAPAKTGQGDWQTYVNVRYGYRVCYPANLLEAEPEADNSDGRVFRGREGAVLRVFGNNGALETSLAEEARDQARNYLGQRGKISYRAARHGWVVISGDDGAGTEFYTKTFQRGDQFLAFHLKYSKAAARLYKPLVERLNRCFVPLKPGS